MALTDNLEAWYEFDDSGGLFHNTVSPGTGDLTAINGTATIGQTSIGVGQRWVMPGNTGGVSLEVGGSNTTGTHWSLPKDGDILTMMCVVDLDSYNPSGTHTVFDKYTDHAVYRLYKSATGPSWRFQVNPKFGSTVTARADTSVTGLLFVFAEVNCSADTISLWVYDTVGDILDSEIGTSITSGGLSDNSESRLVLGKITGGSPDGAIEISAFWSRTLSSGERDQLVNGGGALGYGDFQHTPKTEPFRNLERAGDMHIGDVRSIWVGDSFASPFAFSRVFPAVLKGITYQNLTALGVGSDASLDYLLWSSQVTGREPVRIANGNDYEVQNFTGGGSYFGLPTYAMQEFYFDFVVGIPPSGEFWRFEIVNSDLADGNTGRFTNAGDTLSARILYRTPNLISDQFPDCQMSNTQASSSSSEDPATPVDLDSGARPLYSSGKNPGIDPTETPPANRIVASGATHTWSSEMDGNPVLTVEEGASDPTLAPGEYFTSAGLTVYHSTPTGARIQGQYLQVIADSSWSFVRHTVDAESTGANPKQYLDDQLLTWVDSTTLSLNQKTIVIPYMDVENADLATQKLRMTNHLARWRTMMSDIGIDDFVYFILIPHLHRVAGLTEAQSRDVFEDFRDAAYEMADENDDVCALSLYDHTGLNWFSGARQNSIDWLTDNGFSTFSYGTVGPLDLTSGGTDATLLDAGYLHPNGVNSAIAFATMIELNLDLVGFSSGGASRGQAPAAYRHSPHWWTNQQ